MESLISKIQYDNFEAGEFVDIKERTYNEVIELIQNFPWNKQREHLVVSLTNPSITIEGNNNDYLKLALSYNQKYVLYYLSDDGTLYTKSFEQLESTFNYIEQFFEKTDFDTTGFKKTSSSFNEMIGHFRTDDFNYVMTNKNIQKLFFKYFIAFIYGFGVLLLLYNDSHSIYLNDRVAFLKILVGGSAFLLIGFPILFFYNHYKHSKNKLLIVSKGNPIFYYGNIDAPIEYNKNDILQIFINNSRSSSESTFKIEFKNGQSIQISLLLLANFYVQVKFSDIPIIRKFINPLITNPH